MRHWGSTRKNGAINKKRTPFLDKGNAFILTCNTLFVCVSETIARTGPPGLQGPALYWPSPFCWGTVGTDSSSPPRQIPPPPHHLSTVQTSRIGRAMPPNKAYCEEWIYLHVPDKSSLTPPPPWAQTGRTKGLIFASSNR